MAANAQNQQPSQRLEEKDQAQRGLQTATRGATANPSVAEAYGKLPLSFEKNEGQTDAKVKYLARGQGYGLFLTSTEAVLALPGARCKDTGTATKAELRPRQLPAPCTAHQAVVRLQLLGADPGAQISGMDPLPGRSNYFIGNDRSRWRTDVPNYSKVKYENVYRGIDLLYYGNQRQLEFDLVVAPGADPSQVRFKLAGANKLQLDADGNLVVRVAGGDVRLHKPVVYQPTANGKKPIAANYVLGRRREVSLEIASYDANQPLVVDPVLQYSTFIGGSSLDLPASIAVDQSGNAYITGITFSVDFPTSSPLQSSGGIFVSKLNPSGSALVYSTYFGTIGFASPGFGTAQEGIGGIALDSSGNVYLTGIGLGPSFPVVNQIAGACDANCQSGSVDATFISKINAAGSAIVYSSLVGGSIGNAVAVDSLGNAYVAGQTTSAADFPAVNAFQPAAGGSSNTNAFLFKVNPAGSALVYSTFLGGSSFDEATGVAVDSSGNVYVAGDTLSPNFPVVNQIPNACLSTCGTGKSQNIFLTKFNPAGSALTYSTLVGGSDDSNAAPNFPANINGSPAGSGGGSSLAIDATGNAYVTGTTSPGGGTTQNSFPTTLGALQPTNGNCPGSLFACRVAFAFKVNAAGTALSYSTFLGTNGGIANGIAVDSSGNLALEGIFSLSTVNPVSSQPGVTLAVLNPAGSALVLASSLSNGGTFSGGGPISGVFDSTGNLYVTGNACSGLPVTSGAFQSTCKNIAGIPNFGGTAGNAFVSKISLSGTVSTPVASLVPSFLQFGVQGVGTTSVPTPVTLTNTGVGALTVTAISFAGTNAGDFGQSNNCNSIAAGASCIINVTFTPTSTGTRDASLVVASNASSTDSVSAIGVGTSVVFSPTALSFTGTVGSSSPAQNVTLTNAASTPLNISGITATAPFSQTNTCGSSVAASANCTISVTFTPTVPGPVSATVSVADNAPGSPQAVFLNGSAAALVLLNPASLSFSSQPVGTPSAPQSVTLTNNGSTTLNISGITATAPFSETNTCGSSVAASANCTINVTFTPTAVGSAQGSLSIADSAAGSPQVLPLGGTGAAANAPAVTLAPASLTFSSQTVGTASSAQSVTLINSGNATLNLTGITITGTNAGDYSETNTCAATLATSATCAISVTFKPTASGARTASVSIADNASGSPQTIPLSGTAVAAPAPAVTFAPTSLTFASQLVGSSSAAQSVTLTNSGNATLSITGVTITGTNAGDYSETNTCAATLAASANCAISVTFKPTATGTRTASVSIADNASGSPQTVAISGTATTPDFALNASPASLSVTAGQSGTSTITVTPSNGFNQAVSFSCSGLPTGASCSFAPTAVTPTGAAASTKLTISTAASAAFAPPSIALRIRPFSAAPLMAAWFVLLMLGIMHRLSHLASRRRSMAYAASFSVLLLISVLGGCAGASKPKAVTTAVTVTGTSGSGQSAITHTTALSLTVTP